MTPEGKIQNRVIKWAKKRFIKVTRRVFRPGVEAGWPDAEFLIPGGMPVFIEFKPPGEVPTALQRERIEYLEKNGYHVAWFDNSEDAIAYLVEKIAAGRERLHQRTVS